MCRIKKHFQSSMSIFTQHIGNEISKFNKELKMENEVRLINANAYQYPGDLINDQTINEKEVVIAEWKKKK